MSVATRARPSRSVERRSERPPLRWRTVFLAVLAALFVVAMVGVWYLSTAFQPLRLNAGGGPSFVRAEAATVETVPALEPSSGHPFIAHEVQYLDGTWVEAGFTVVNDGPFPATVDAVGGGGAPIKQISVSLNDPSTSAFGPQAPTLLVPFEPFTLQAGDARFVVVRYRFVGCSMDQTGEAVLKASERVDFGIEMAGITIHRSESLPLPFSLRVVGDDGCP